MATTTPTLATSADGTPIAEPSGAGRPIVLVGGAFNDRSACAGLAAAWGSMPALAHTLPHDSALFARDHGIRGEERYAGIAVPVLAIAGGASPAWLQAGAAPVAELVPGAKHATMPGADHSVLHQPADLAALMGEFLAGGR